MSSTPMWPAVAKFTAPTALAVPGPQVFPSDLGPVVTLTNWTERDEAGERHRGLFVDAALEAVNPDDAIRRALGPASVIVSMLSFASAAAAGHLRPVIAYVERTDQSCDVLQFDEWPVEPSSRRMLKKERVQAVVGRQNALPEGDRARIFRALDSYRSALGETNVFDRFGAAWLGLEAMNPVLRARRALPTTRRISCPKCGAISEVPDITGVMDLVTRRIGAEEASHLRRFRQQFMHSTRPLHELLDDARRATLTAVGALRFGLLELFLMSQDEEALLLEPTPMRLPERNRARYMYRMQPLRIATVPPGQATPRLGQRPPRATREVMPDGRTRERTVHELEIKDFTGEVPSPFELHVAIPSADPDDRARSFELSSFDFVSKDTGEVIGTASVTSLSAEELDAPEERNEEPERSPDAP